jgi:hypothetical protein
MLLVASDSQFDPFNPSICSIVPTIYRSHLICRANQIESNGHFKMRVESWAALNRPGVKSGDVAGQ